MDTVHAGIPLGRLSLLLAQICVPFLLESSGGSRFRPRLATVGAHRLFLVATMVIRGGTPMLNTGGVKVGATVREGFFLGIQSIKTNGQSQSSSRL